MRACGIVAEFNPLHNGHKYIMDEARRLTGCAALVIAMSGDYVQRGEPAITDKWSRTEAALNAGADLVLEIPTLFCLGNAGQYARAGVGILESLGCVDKICCGSESGDAESIKILAGLMMTRGNEIEEAAVNMIKEGISYPAARECAVRDILAADGMSDSEIKTVTAILSKPNDILALEYCMAAGKSEVFTVKRKGTDYFDEFKPGEEIQSASAIRSLFKEGTDDSIKAAMSSLSKYSAKLINSEKLTFPSDWTEILRYAVMSSDAEAIDECPSGGEGLGYALKDAVVRCGTFDEIVAAVKSKRYTYTRISRLCMQVILGISRDEYPLTKPEFVRVLGFTDRGRKLLSYIKRNELASLPIITNINKESEELGAAASDLLELDIKSSDIYNLISGRSLREFSDRVMSPVMV